MNKAVLNHPAAEEAIQRWGELKSTRAFHEPDWEDIARLIRPQRGGFSMSRPENREMEKPLSSEPIMAQSSFASGIYASITNPANRWAGLETPDPEFNAWKPMAEWNDLATRRVLQSLAPTVSPFYSATFQAYSDIAAFGNAAGYDEIDLGKRKFVDVTMSLAEVVVDIDAHGRVNELVRKFTLTPRGAVREFGRDALPERVVEAAANRDSGRITFYRHILPNDDFVPGKLGHRGKPFLSITACEEGRALVKVGGYGEMPVYFPRWDVDSGHTYGTGPGFISLASARMVHQMEAATIRAAQFAADPVKLAPDRDAIPLDGVIRPGEVLYGGVNMRGQEMVRNMTSNPNIGLTMEEKRAKVEAIKEAYHYAIMSLSGRTGITSEESMIMEEARLRNWAPHADRIMEEYGARKIERRFRMLWRAGQIPPPPSEAQGMPLQVRYQSQATMALRAREGQAIRQFLNDLAPLAQLDSRYVDRVDPDGLTEALHDASPTLPARILRSREEADQIAQGRAQQQQLQQAMQAAQTGGGVVRDLASAMGGQRGA
ncbi:portal protein [Oceanicola sp. S124]|uniref:portal protein n=1 Tax=Oceanicola sp. S124 TaxID=1042378 RepID=UPI0002558999|nr:portal protein [Oceanicola sp. S124]